MVPLRLIQKRLQSYYKGLEVDYTPEFNRKRVWDLTK
jgi:hypothetical protein